MLTLLMDNPLSVKLIKEYSLKNTKLVTIYCLETTMLKIIKLLLYYLSLQLLIKLAEINKEGIMNCWSRLPQRSMLAGLESEITLLDLEAYTCLDCLVRI